MKPLSTRKHIKCRISLINAIKDLIERSEANILSLGMQAAAAEINFIFPVKTTVVVAAAASAGTLILDAVVAEWGFFVYVHAYFEIVNRKHGMETW